MHNDERATNLRFYFHDSQTRRIRSHKPYRELVFTGTFSLSIWPILCPPPTHAAAAGGGARPFPRVYVVKIARLGTKLPLN